MDENYNNENNEQENSVPEEESNAAKRLRMLGISIEPEAPTEPIKKAGFFENFWYHYKGVTLAVLAALIIIGIGVYQLATKVTPDIYIMYSGPYYYNNTSSVMRALTSVMDEDYNGDGEKTVNILQTVRYSEAQIAAAEAEANKLKEEAIKNGQDGKKYEFSFDYQFNASEYERFMTEIMTGESVICLIDPSLYEEIAGDDVLLSLEEALGYTPDEAFDDYAITFKELKFAKYYSCFDKLPEDTLLIIRRTTAMTAFKGKRAKKAHENHVDYFKDIVEFEYPDGYEE